MRAFYSLAFSLLWMAAATGLEVRRPGNNPYTQVAPSASFKNAAAQTQKSLAHLLDVTKAEIKANPPPKETRDGRNRQYYGGGPNLLGMLLQIQLLQSLLAPAAPAAPAPASGSSGTPPASPPAAPAPPSALSILGLMALLG